MSKLKINLFGSVELVGREEATLTRKVKGVAAFLALQRGQPSAREKLAALFWENSPEEQARTNLRQCLSSLRKQLQGALITKDDLVLFDLSQIELDAIRFEELITSEDAQEIEEAASIYKADLLDGFNFKEDAFESWLRPERERYRNLMIGGLTRLISAKEASGDHAAIATLTARLLVMDPINEAAHRTLMKTYAAQGRYEAALKQFETCKQMLARELGVGPRQQTIDILNEVHRQRKPNAARSDIVLGRNPETGRLEIDLSLPNKPSVAVMPFSNLSDVSGHKHFAKGLTDEITTTLCQIDKLFVVAPSSMAGYAGEATDVTRIRREQGIRYILEGSVQWAADRLRVTSKLIDSETGRHVWGDQFDGAASDIFNIQDHISKEVTVALQVRLTDGEQARAWARGTDDLQSWSLTVRAAELIARHQQKHTQKAKGLVQEALHADPNYVDAWCELGWCHWSDARHHWSGCAEASLKTARELGEKARNLNSDIAGPWLLLALTALQETEFEEAINYAEKALALGRGQAFTVAISAMVFEYCGRAVEAVNLLQEAMRLTPIYPPWYRVCLGRALHLAGDMSQAIEVLTDFAEYHDGTFSFPVTLVTALHEVGQQARARSIAQEALRREPTFTIEEWSEPQKFARDSDLARYQVALEAIGLPMK